MKRAMIEPGRCGNCASCIVELNCEKRAIIRESVEDKPWIDFYHCTGCMKCKSLCPKEAVVEISHPCNAKPGKGW